MNFLKLLPRFFRLRLIRNRIRIMAPPPGLQIKIATTKEELEKVYSLLHDCYVGTKLMAPETSGLRCNYFTFLPSTTAVIALIDNKIVGTVSLIKDSSAGLPSDKDFREENDRLRLDGHNLVEVSSLAIEPSFRKKSHVVSLYLMKYLQRYTTHHMGCTTISCVVHPRAKDFYAAFWGFHSSKKIIKYKFVNDALGVHVYGKVTDETLSLLENRFSSALDRNPIKFLFTEDKFLIYPPRRIENHLDPVYTPELLKHFMADRTQVYKTLSRSQLMNIFTAYSLYFDNLNDLNFFKNLVTDLQPREFRLPCKVRANLAEHSSLSVEGEILDITKDGAFFATSNSLELNKNYVLDFKIAGQKFSVPAQATWQNRRNRNFQQIGYGIKFLQPQFRISEIFKETHLTAFSKKSA
jgi:hypothetical protein